MTKEKLREYRRARYQKQRELIRAQQTKWYENNKDSILEARKRRRLVDPSWREKVNAAARKWNKDNLPAWRDTNREHLRARSRDWYHKHKDEINARKRLRRKTDPEWRKHTNAQALAFQKGPYAEKRRTVLRQFMYGLTDEEYSALKEKQQGLCAICDRAKRLFIDHSHSTGRVRGLLCARCNWGIGNFDDNTSLLQKAIVYLSS